MKIIMTDDVTEVSPGVLLFTKEFLDEILEFARRGEDLPEHGPTTGAMEINCPICKHGIDVDENGWTVLKCPNCKIDVPRKNWLPRLYLISAGQQVQEMIASLALENDAQDRSYQAGKHSSKK